jgi:hypothetical protein
MKRQILLLIFTMFLLSMVNAQNGQVNYDLPSRDGHVKTSSTTFYETNTSLETKNNPSASRITFIEFPVNEFVAASKVDLEIDYYYTNKKDQQVPVNIDIMEGGLIDTIKWDYQPDSSEFTSIAALELLNDANYGWKTFDMTNEYNAAIINGAEYITVRVSVATQDTTDALLKFRSSEVAGSEPRLLIDSNCPRYRIDVDTIVCAGTTIQIGDETVSLDGVYTDSLITTCGADSVRTYYVMFILDGTVDVDTAVCAGDIYTIVTGPRTTKDYGEAGTYKDTITNGSCTQITVTNLSHWNLPVPQDLGDDVTIKEAETVTLDAGTGFIAYQWFNDGSTIGSETAQTLVVDVNKEAFHTSVNEISVIVTDGNGCQGEDEIWVEIKGNLFETEKDGYIEKISDVLKDISSMLVKYDTELDPDFPEEPPLGYTRETLIGFDLTNAEVTAEMSNYRLRLNMIQVLNGPGAEEGDTVNLAVNCHYVDEIYDDGMVYSTRFPDVDRIKLADPQIVRIDDQKRYVEWNINDIFVDQILGKINQFTIILSTYDDITSSLAKFTSSENKNPDLRPAIVYDVAATGVTRELVIDQVLLYPNPVTDMLHISARKHFSKAVIYDVTGKSVLSYHLNGSSVNLSSLENGMYVIRLENEYNTVYKRIIKQ